MRLDGDYLIYMIQHKAGKGWDFSNFDAFGTPEGFSASGDCWQKTGVHGTFDLDEARIALEWIQKKHPEHEFRLVMRRTVQTTVPVPSVDVCRKRGYHRILAFGFECLDCGARFTPQEAMKNEEKKARKMEKLR